MKMRRIVLVSAAGLASVLFFTGLAAYKPGDFGHVVSVADAEGGKARHGVHLPYGFHRYSILVTSRAKIDQPTDLKIAVEGKNVPPFEIVGRNPPVLNLGVHQWPVYAGDSIKGVQPDEKIAFYVILKPTEKDPVCGMWVNATGTVPAHKHDGVCYHFCSLACREEFAGSPVRFANQLLSPENIRIILTDDQQRKVLTVPVTFTDARSKDKDQVDSGRAPRGRPSSAGKQSKGDSQKECAH